MISALVAALSLIVIPTAAHADGLSSVRWQYRPLLIFTPTGDDRRLSRQTTILADVARGIIDRRLAVYIIEERRVYTTFGAPAPDANARALRRRFRVPDDGFRVVLIGLDGAAKLSEDAPISAQHLFSVIDAMPMRRQELRERQLRPGG